MNKFFKGLKIAWNIIKVVWALSMIVAIIIIVGTSIYFLIGKSNSPDWAITFCICSFFYILLNTVIILPFILPIECMQEDAKKKGG